MGGDPRIIPRAPHPAGLGGRLLDLAREDPGRRAVGFFEGGDPPVVWLSRGELIRRAGGIAAALSGRTAPGDVVALVMPPSLTLMTSWVGTVLAGRIPTICAPPSFKFDALHYADMIRTVIRGTRATLIASDSDTLAAHFRDSGATCLDVNTLGDAAPNGRPAAVRAPHALLQHSSGTTGLQKGILLSHEQVQANTSRYAEAIRLDGTDVVASWLPIYHDMGLIACLVMPLLAGIPSVHASPFQWVLRPSLLWDMVTASGGTRIWMPNFAFRLLAERATPDPESGWELSRVRQIVNCAEPVRLEDMRALFDTCASRGLRETAMGASYALAENTFAVTEGGVSAPLEAFEADANALRKGRLSPAAPGRPRTTLLSSGRPIADTEVRIADESGAVLPPDRTGEILLKSPSLFDGYCNRGPADSRIDPEGFYHTGDVGVMDADRNLFVTGRKSDMIIVAGANIHPEDVEHALAGMKGILPGRAVACGEYLDSLGTERIVVLAETTWTEAGRRETLIREIRERISNSLGADVAEVALVPPRWLVKSTSGKPSRRRCLAKWRVTSPPPSAPRRA
ncbi:MAG: AMP-binding protein [Planctomycetota bacterium]